MCEPKKNFLLAALLASLALAGCFGRKSATAASTGPGESAEPDKVLFEKATDDLNHSRYSVARLSLQTLINTYPDSEYLAKSKLAIADSYYKEGGTTGLTQAEAEYQDFITFFPFLDEAAYAQMQIGAAHYRQMEKPDRDRNEAEQAEAAFQTFLQKYPNSPFCTRRPNSSSAISRKYSPKGISASPIFYYFRKADRAAVSRLAELAAPLSPLQPVRPARSGCSGRFTNATSTAISPISSTQKVVRDYPLSAFAADSKTKLAQSNLPLPQPDPTALARMQKEQQTSRPRANFATRSLDMLRTGPDVAMAAHNGVPTLTPPEDPNNETLALGGTTAAGVAPPSGATTGAMVAIVGSGSSPATASASNPTQGSTAALSTDPASGSDSSASATADPPASANSTSPASGAAPPANQKESSSKKKKGLRKVVPF